MTNRAERERTIDKMIEKNCPHCGAATPEEAHYCLQCMTPCTPAQPSAAYLKLYPKHGQKRIGRKQLSSVLAAMILLVVLIPSVLAAPLQQQNAVTADGALTGTVQAAETQEDEQPKTLLGKVKKAAKKAEQKVQSATGKMKEAVGIAPTAEEKQAMANEAAGTAPPAPQPRPQTATPNPAAPQQRPPRSLPPNRKVPLCPSRNITTTSTP